LKTVGLWASGFLISSISGLGYFSDPGDITWTITWNVSRKHVISKTF